jgi:hypothetical protein
MKHFYKKFIIYLTLGFFCSLITVFFELNSLAYPKLLLEGIAYYSVFIFLNDVIIRWFYLKTNIPSFIKVLINIVVGLSLLVLGRYLVSPFEIYQLLTFDLFLVILFPLIIIGDVNLDLYIRKSFDKYNVSLRKFRNKKN